jgi:hypothetical protein
MEAWAPTHPREASKLLGAVRVPWWVAGGWALDLFLGAQSRPHKDLDIGILRRDAPEVVEAMQGWEFAEAKDGELSTLSHRQPRPEVNCLWGRPRGTSPWVIELLLDEAEGDTWMFRRKRDIRRPLKQAIRRDGEGIPYLAPEIQLLYKANRLKPEDDADFWQVALRLDGQARAWLDSALASMDRYHPWLDLAADASQKERA